MISIGTCGFRVPQARAMRELAAVEIQRTFDGPVPRATARRWRERAPAGFQFTVKASRLITHGKTSPSVRRPGAASPRPSDGPGAFRDTAEVLEGWEATRSVAEVLRAAAIVFQCPPTFGPSPDHVRDLYRFFESTTTNAARVWEPGGPWASHLVDKVCADLDLVHCVDPAASEPATSGLAYFRPGGAPPGSDSSYPDEDLDRLLATCWEYDDAFVMFNNASAHSDAVRAQAMLASPPRRPP